MKFLLYTTGYGRSASLQLSQPRVFIAVVLAAMLVLAGAVYSGYRLGQSETAFPAEYTALSDLQAQLMSQTEQLGELRESSRSHLDALAMRLGQIQSEMLRIEALGKRLAAMAKLDKGEFDFDRKPAQGGPAAAEGASRLAELDISKALDELEAQLEDRAMQLEVLERLVMNQNLKEQISPAGRPINSGWTSSYFGKRTDPFTGRREMHRGMDFAGKLGTEINATAAGVVTWAGRRYGYGNLVEINHGNGYSTRYGHCQKVLVKVGDKVEPGQKIALMGSTGRSTGPHVHYEVLKNGRKINPARFIRASR